MAGIVDHWVKPDDDDEPNLDLERADDTKKKGETLELKGIVVSPPSPGPSPPSIKKTGGSKVLLSKLVTGKEAKI